MSLFQPDYHHSNMMDEYNPVDQLLSLSYCNTHFGHYGVFATLPLRTFHNGHSKLANYLEGLAFRRSNFFTSDESRILLKMKGTVRVVSNEQIESDLRDLRSEVQRGDKMAKSHALALIKAIEFWKLRFMVRYLDWKAECEIADTLGKPRLSMVSCY
jgi:hypothetical protein